MVGKEGSSLLTGQGLPVNGLPWAFVPAWANKQVLPVGQDDKVFGVARDVRVAHS
jgi:hypothetical protein